MILSIEILLLILVVILAFVSLWIRDLISAVIVFGAYSFLMCLIWTGMGAVDVAFTEAAVGAGVSTVFFIAVLYNTTRRIRFNPLDLSSKIFATFLCTAVGYLLFLGISDLPEWGDANSPVNTNVAGYYVESAYKDTKVPNLVTAVLADYRGFDTMFETCVVFIAVLGIFMLLKKEDDEVTDSSIESQTNDSLIIRVASRFMVPFIQLFGLYVVAHGHHSPGGGFQGGVILGASLILLAMAYDMKYVQNLLSMRKMIVFSALGVFIFAGWGLVPVFLGSNFLDYSAWAALLPGTDAIMARSHSMLAVEVGVALTVMCGMYGIYMSLVSDGGFKKGL
ncbi:sodium:proton antiporter [Candidatus Marinamargulisbacteria bacterium SCGC AG-343-K17]|nr:sodium:proton antiporter [Candidatus Marinamargulisbacteria bacterium SCGC AG-343-K17]